MAINEQCSKCGRDLGSCPFYSKEEANPCNNYLNPIDNSAFFSHFFTTKGRIGRVQYLVTVLIAVALFYLICFYTGMLVGATVGASAISSNTTLIITICFIPAAALIIIAGIKRCHDSSAAWGYALMPIILLFVVGLIPLIIGLAAFFFLLIQKGDEGLNAYGTEPLKPYAPQIEWHQEEQQ